MAARPEASKKVNEDAEMSWLKEIDLSKQSLLLRLAGGRVKGNNGTMVEAISIGHDTPLANHTLEFDALTRSFIVRKDGKIEKVLLGVYAIEVV